MSSSEGARRKGESAESAQTLSRANALISALLLLALGFCAWRFKSDLALAQATDSLLDVAGSLVLAWVVAVGIEPQDSTHPMGHSRAEPLGALGIAMLSAVLALEVGSHAAQSIMGGPTVQPSFVLLGLFVLKVLFKLGVLSLASGKSAPAFRALTVDARNDVLVGFVAVVGFILARNGFPAVDAWLALPIALWIGWSGLQLARENINLLMGAAPPTNVQEELLALAGQVPGIIDAHDLRAQYLGTMLSVHLHVSVDETLSVRDGHDLGEAVRIRLLTDAAVGHCSVHVDPAPPSASPRLAQ